MGQGFASQRLGVNIFAGTGQAQTGTVVFSNANSISFGMQQSASSYVVTASFSQSSAPTPSVSYFDNGAFASASVGLQTSQMAVAPMIVPFRMSATMLDMLASYTNLGLDFTASVRVGVYTMSGSTASLASSMSTTQLIPNGGGLAGSRLSIGTWAFTPGGYLIAVNIFANFSQQWNLYGAANGIAFTTAPFFAEGAVSVSTGMLQSSFNVSQITGNGNRFFGRMAGTI